MTGPIPVFPTCHDVMGGTPTNVHGEVLRDNEHMLPGLHAASECACVSAHGSNRLSDESSGDHPQALHDVRLQEDRYGHITVHDKGSGTTRTCWRRSSSVSFARHTMAYKHGTGLSADIWLDCKPVVR